MSVLSRNQEMNLLLDTSLSHSGIPTKTGLTSFDHGIQAAPLTLEKTIKLEHLCPSAAPCSNVNPDFLEWFADD